MLGRENAVLSILKVGVGSASLLLWLGGMGPGTSAWGLTGIGGSGNVGARETGTGIVAVARVSVLSGRVLTPPVLSAKGLPMGCLLFDSSLAGCTCFHVFLGVFLALSLVLKYDSTQSALLLRSSRINVKIAFFTIREEDGVSGVPMHARAILIRCEWNAGENSIQVSWPDSFFIAATVSETRYAHERYNLARKVSSISSNRSSIN